jgi:hydroxymethylglutaryl-CoA lyase
MSKRPRLRINEVAPRDGLQNETAFVSTADKIALIDALSQTGLSRIEATAFVSPTAIPALADAVEVMRGIARVPGVIYTALIPNRRGAERALESGVDEFNLVMSASETHNLTNLRMTRQQSVRSLDEVMDLAREARMPVNVSLSCSFGCPMEGDVDPAEVLRLASHFNARGAAGVTLCDTTGMAYPSQVAGLASAYKRQFPHSQLTLHVHDTRGLALANVMAAAQVGVEHFDASLGGLGGCPYAPGASGNACTEDMVHMLELIGYDTGVDLASLIACAERLPGLIGHAVPSQMLRAGPRDRRHPVPASFESIRERALARDAA